MKPRAGTRAISTLLKLFLVASGPLLVIFGLHASPPPSPTNVRSIVLPAEVLVAWDASPDAAYYAVKRGEIDRRWVPLDSHLVTPRVRDTDFHALPCYYEITVF